MQQRFLLKILLPAQHVSGTTMAIIRSSRVLYSGCCLCYFVLWFSSCWSGAKGYVSGLQDAAAPLFVVNISPSFGQFTAPLRHILPIQNVTINRQQFVCQFPLDVHVLRWEIVWRNAPRIWRDFGSVLPFQTRLTHTKSVLLLSNEHGSQVKDHCRRQCCHNKHNIFLIALHVMYLYFPDTPRKKKYRTKLL